MGASLASNLKDLSAVLGKNLVAWKKIAVFINLRWDI
jgi:hypothetical protein